MELRQPAMWTNRMISFEARIAAQHQLALQLSRICTNIILDMLTQR